jgi:hypothetical protein
VNELFNRYRDAKPKARIPTHYHDDDYNMVSLYLMGQFPERYAPYSTPLLQAVCTKLGAKDAPVAADFPRYTKLLQTLRPFLEQEPGLMETYQENLRSVDYSGDSALLVYWFFRSLTEDTLGEASLTVQADIGKRE